MKKCLSKKKKWCFSFENSSFCRRIFYCKLSLYSFTQVSHESSIISVLYSHKLNVYLSNVLCLNVVCLCTLHHQIKKNSAKPRTSSDDYGESIRVRNLPKSYASCYNYIFLFVLLKPKTTRSRYHIPRILPSNYF